MPDNEEQNQADLAGYPSVDELAKAYRSSSDEGKRQRQRADQLEQRLGQLESQFTRQSVPDRGNPADRLSEYGVPVDALEQFIGQRIQSGISQAFEPISRGIGARNTVLSEYPDYSKYEADVARFIESDPNLNQSYQRVFATDPVAAMEFAFLKFGETKRREAPARSGAQSSARAEAQIPSSRNGDARTLPGTQGEEMIQRTWDHFQKTGDPRAFAKARIRQVVSDEFLNR